MPVTNVFHQVCSSSSVWSASDLSITALFVE